MSIINHIQKQRETLIRLEVEEKNFERRRNKTTTTQFTEEKKKMKKPSSDNQVYKIR